MYREAGITRNMRGFMAGDRGRLAKEEERGERHARE